MAGSIGIIMAIGVSAFLGWFLLPWIVCFPSKTSTRPSSRPPDNPVTQIFLDTVGENGAIVFDGG